LTDYNFQLYRQGMNPISRCVDLAGGLVALTREVNKRIARPVTYQALRKWVVAGRLPRTEWTGETAYAAAISAAVQGQVSVDELLKLKEPPPPAAQEAA
jgi:hypothetical protein